MSHAVSARTTVRRGAKVLVTPVLAGAVTFAGQGAVAEAAPLPAQPLPAAPVQAAPAQTASVQSAAKMVSYRYLRYNSRGSRVKAVQRKLRVRPVSGWYGPITRRAVKRFQRKHGLRVTGTVTYSTWRHLKIRSLARSSRSYRSGTRPGSYSFGRRVMALAASKAGRPYRWGAMGPYAFDCSGYTGWVYRNAGMKLPRTSRQQRAATRRISRPAVGDLVFVSRYGRVSHVAIYAGGGYWWESTRPGRPIGKHRAWSRAVSYGRA